MRIAVLAAYASCVFMACVVLAGCGGHEAQSQLGLSPASEQNSTPDFIGPATGKKKGGPYWWVWVSAKVPWTKTKTIIAYCPKSYVVTGGGYTGKNGAEIGNPHPLLPQLNGWTISAYGDNQSGLPSNATVYAVCAPTT